MIYDDYINIINGSFKPNFLRRDIIPSRLNVEIIHKAILKKPTLELPAKVMNINISDNSGNLCLTSHHLRGPNHDVFQYQNKKLILDEQHIRLDGEYIYLGWVFPHYGHFLMETLSRLWVLGDIEKKDYKYIFNYYGNSINTIKNKSWAKQLLACFGIDSKNIFFINTDTVVEKLYIPSQSLILHDSVNISAQSFIWSKIRNTYCESLIQPFRYIYLSRRGVKNDGRKLINEEFLEKKLKDIGVEIISPENYSLQEQVKILSESKVVIGPSGSALHNAAFMQKGTHVISLTTSKFCLLNEALCCLAANTTYSIYFGNNEQHNQWRVKPNDLVEYVKSIM